MKKTKTLLIRLTKEQLKELEAIAKKYTEGNVSALLRKAGLSYGKRND